MARSRPAKHISWTTVLDQRQTFLITSRSAPRAVLDRADLVTEMREIRHYYRRGVAARAGIEF